MTPLLVIFSITIGIITLCSIIFWVLNDYFDKLYVKEIERAKPKVRSL